MAAFAIQAPSGGNEFHMLTHQLCREGANLLLIDTHMPVNPQVGAVSWDAVSPDMPTLTCAITGK